MLALFWVVYSRYLLPMADRLEQGLEIVAGVGDLVTFVCALALLLSPVSSVEYSVVLGSIMIANQARRLRNILTCWPLIL